MKAFIILNHKPNQEQLEDLKRMGVEEIVRLPEELKKIWADIDPAAEDVIDQIRPILSWLEGEIKKAKKAGEEAVVWVQGEPTATEAVVLFSVAIGAKPIMATSRRESVETTAPDGSVVKTSVFRHVRFREYPVARLLPKALTAVHGAAVMDGMPGVVDLPGVFRWAVREELVGDGIKGKTLRTIDD